MLRNISNLKIPQSNVLLQIPYYWPSHQTKNPDNVDYAIFLVKRNLRNKQRHGLEDFEMVN